MILGERKTIGVFISKAYEYFDNAVFPALAREAKRLDYDVIVFTVVGNRKSSQFYDIQEKSIFDFAPLERLDGVIAVPDSFERGEFRDGLYAMLERVKCPVVAVRHESDQLNCAYTDENEAIRPLIRHLIREHGLRRICFLAGYPGHHDSELRLKAYRQEMAENGLEIPENGVYHGTMWTNCGEQAHRHFFSDPDNRPEAVVCANDHMAVGLMRALRAKGVRVPEDVLVTGFDNVPSFGVDVPTLTTVQPDYAGMIARAMAYLDGRIRGGAAEDGAPARMGLPGKLVLGESCGCCKRAPGYFERFARETTASLERLKRQENRMTYLSIELSACEDLNDLHRVLMQWRDYLAGVQDFYLCLFHRDGAGEVQPGLVKDMTDTVCLVHAMCDRQDHGMPMITFERERLLPPVAERPDEAQMFFVKLLHQKGSKFGYAAYQYSEGMYPSEFFPQCNVLLSIALQNIQKRDELMMLYEERRLSSITDMLTGLLNRRGLMEKIEPEWPRLCARRDYATFVCFDMDRLKQINDTYGHAAGDFALRLIARAIQLALPRDGEAARIGGDEFVVFLPEANQRDAERFRAAFEARLGELNAREKRAFAVSASVGLATVRLDDFSTVEQCIQAGDEVMYREKEARHMQRDR